MKNLLLSYLLLIATGCFASRTDSLFQRHQISFALTNAMSQQFFNGPSGPTVTHKNYQIPGYLGSVQFLPLNALHLKLDYSIGITRNIRIETGLGYLLEGMTLTGGFEDDQMYGFPVFGSMYIDKLTFPIHIKLIKPVGKGIFTCTLGPSFTVPIDFFFAPKLPYDENNALYDPWSPSHSSLGFDLKMGYEKRIRKNILINVGPIVNFSDLVFFSKRLNQIYTKTQYRPYQYYIGFDVAFNFEVGKKK